MEKKNYQTPLLEITELMGTVLVWYSNGTPGDGVVGEGFFE